MRYIDCPCCGASEFSPWAEEGGFQAAKCSDCGIVYVRNPPDPESISSAARDGVHQTEGGTLDQRYAYRSWKVPYYAGIIRRFFPEERGLTWLDVGCGYGEFVQAVKKAVPDAKPTGIDPMTNKVEAGQRRGLPVRQLTLDEVEGQFDVVSLINVFSHIPDFKAFGQQLRSLIRPGGSLFLETGNGGDLRSRADYPGDLLLPDHLVFAGVDQLKRILADIGFEQVEHHACRIDTPIWAAKQTAKRLLRNELSVVLPYRSSFRTVFYRAHF